MNKRKALWTAVFLGTVTVLCIAGTKISRLTQTTSIQGDTLFLVVTGSQAAGTLQTRSIEFTNLLPYLSGASTNAVTSVSTNGGLVSSAATALNIIAGTNVVVNATNTAGVVDVRINSTGGSGGGIASTNSNQFGESTTLTLKDGPRLTNIVGVGIQTNVGTHFRLRGDANPTLEITSITLPQTLYANSTGIGTRSGGGQAYIVISPEETATLEIAADSVKPVNGTYVALGTVGRPFSYSYFDHWVSASNIFLGPAVKILQGNASPEGVYSAQPQSLYFQTNQTSGIGLWLKTNGTGSSGWWLFSGVGGGGGLSDGDKGDLTVSGSGTSWTIDNDVVTYAKIQDISTTKRVLGRNTSGSGDPEEVSITQLLDWAGSAAQGDLLYRGASTWSLLPAGTSGQLLQTPGPGSNPNWATVGTLTDSDKGDITVSGSGTVFTIDPGAVTSGKIPDGILLTNASVFTSFKAPNVLYSNVVVVDATNASPIINGTRLTNAIATAVFGTEVQVGPGRYYVPTNHASWIRAGVSIRTHPGSIITVGDPDNTDDEFIFHDRGGAITSSIAILGKLYFTNSGGDSALYLVTNALSSINMTLNEVVTYGAIGANPVIWHQDGKLFLNSDGLLESTSYDAILGPPLGMGTNCYLYFRGNVIKGLNSIIEPGYCPTNGMQVYSFNYGEGGSINVPDNVYIRFNSIKLTANNQIYGSLTNYNAVGSGILEGGVITCKPDATVAVIGAKDAGWTVNTSFRLKNVTIYGPTNLPAIDSSFNTSTRQTNYFTADNVDIIDGWGATNSIYSTNSTANTHGQSFTYVANGYRSIKPLSQSLFFPDIGTNVVTSLDVKGTLQVSSTISGSQIIAGNFDGQGLVRTDVNGYLDDDVLFSGLAWDGTTLAVSPGSSGTNFSGLIITNTLQRTVLSIGSITNPVIAWGQTNVVEWTPASNAGFTLSGTPGNGTNRQVITLTLLLTNSAITSIVFPAAHRDGSAPFLMSVPSTNTFSIVYDGWRTYIESGQEAMPLTNLVSLSISNAVSKPLTNSVANGVARIYGLQATPNGETVMVGTNIAVGANTNLTLLSAHISTLTNDQQAYFTGGITVGDLSALSDVTSSGTIDLRGSLYVNTSITTNNATLLGNTVHAGTNIITGVQRFPVINTNKVLFLEGNSNVVGLGIGTGLAVSGGNLTATASGGSTFNYLPFADTNYVLTHLPGMVWGTQYPNGSTAPAASGVLKSASGSTGNSLIGVVSSGVNGSHYAAYNCAGSGAAPYEARISNNDNLFTASNTPFHFSMLVGFSNAPCTNIMKMELGPSASNAPGDIGAKLGWYAETRGSQETNWIASYHNGSAYVTVNTNAAKTGSWHIPGVANVPSVGMVWYMDGIPVWTNATPGQVAGSGQGPFVGMRTTTATPSTGTNWMFWKFIELKFRATNSTANF